MSHRRGHGAHEDRVSASLQQAPRPHPAAETYCVAAALRPDCFEVRTIAESARRDSRFAFADREIVWFERETDTAQMEIRFFLHTLSAFRGRGHRRHGVRGAI